MSMNRLRENATFLKILSTSQEKRLKLHKDNFLKIGSMTQFWCPEQFLKSRPQLNCALEESIFKIRLLLRGKKLVIIVGFILFFHFKKDGDIRLFITFI